QQLLLSLPISIGSVTDLAGKRRGAVHAEQELPDFQVDVFVATAHEKRNVLDHAPHQVGRGYRLRLYTRSVTIVDAVVPALENLPESILEPGLCVVDYWAAQV